MLMDILNNEVGQFAAFLRAYKECSPQVQAVVDEMVSIINDPDSTDEDREHASATILEALMPALTAELLDTHQLAMQSAASVAARRELRQDEAAFAERLRALMDERNLTQEQLASMTGVSQPAISNILNRQCRPQRRTVRRFADVLNVAPEELWPSYADRESH